MFAQQYIQTHVTPYHQRQLQFQAEHQATSSATHPQEPMEKKSGQGLKRGADGKVKEQAVPSYSNQENPKLCAVCGDKATGNHYNAVTCEACKAFFRRTIQHNRTDTYKCDVGYDNCEINKFTPNKCKKCRITGCFTAGMESNLVRDEPIRGKRTKVIEKKQQLQHQDSALHLLKLKNIEILQLILQAFKTDGQTHDTSLVQKNDGNAFKVDHWQNISTLISPYIMKTMQFAKKLPFFMQLDIKVQQSM